MTTRRAIAKLALAMLLATGAMLVGCRSETTAPPPVLAPIEGGNGRLDWAGMQPCADCDGIETHLALVNDDGRRSFVLTETYLAERPVRFVESGKWQREQALLLLIGKDGARLGYAVLEDGRLQPRDVRGRRLAGSDGDGLLSPVAAATER